MGIPLSELEERMDASEFAEHVADWGLIAAEVEARRG